jgi:hypothetical protein
MDTQTAKIDVTAKIEEIKRFMPETYKSIKAKSAVIGNEAFVLVRRGLRGEADCFYAFEGGRVVGTPFALVDVARDVAQYMVTFGCDHMCVWAASSVQVAGAGNGTH